MKSNRIVIPETEYMERLVNCQTNLKEAGWSGMVLSSESNIQYFTGFRPPFTWISYTRPMFLFLPAQGKPILYLNAFLSAEAEARVPSTIASRSFTAAYGPSVQEVAELMEEAGMHKGVVGFEIGHEQRINYQVDNFLAITEHFKEITVTDASVLLWKQRLIKSPLEVECHRRACQAVDYAFDRIFEEVCEGMDGYEIDAIARKAMLEGGADRDGFVIMTYGEGNYGRTSSVRDGRRLKKGDMLWLDLGAEYEGYWCDFCRAGIVGPIDDIRKKHQKDVYEATMEASKKIAPGSSCVEIAEACVNALKKRGYNDVYECGRLGHGMGLMSTEPPSIAFFEEGFILQEGMIINIEPPVVRDHGVYCLEENFVVTADGCQCLTGASRELYQIKTL